MCTMDRIFQANSSGHELKNIDAQIAVQQVHTLLDQANDVEKFLQTKYTSEEDM